MKHIYERQRMNRKGASFSGWTEAILFSILFVVVIGIIIASMNSTYNKNVDASIGLSTNATQAQFVTLQNQFKTAADEGEASTNVFTGISLSSSWLLIKTIIGVTWSFITGGWIEKLVAYLQFPVIVAVILRLLYFISIGLIILRIIFKLTP